MWPKLRHKRVAVASAGSALVKIRRQRKLVVAMLLLFIVFCLLGSIVVVLVVTVGEMTFEGRKGGKLLLQFGNSCYGNQSLR